MCSTTDLDHGLNRLPTGPYNSQKISVEKSLEVAEAAVAQAKFEFDARGGSDPPALQKAVQLQLLNQ